MQVKLLTILFAVLMLSVTAAAAVPDLNMLNADGNYFYPSKTTTISWTVADIDAPADFNFIISYVNATTMTPVEISSLTGGAGIADRNSNTYCSLPITAVEQVCTYTWTLPTGLDTNYYIDINAYDIVTVDDVNEYSGSIYIDSNACDTGISISDDEVRLIPHCTFASGTADTNTTYYNTSRNKSCADRFEAYSVPFSLSFGEFIICYYSNDGLGNTETTQNTVHTADSDAYNIALLVELALAALLLMVILGGIVLRNEQLNGSMMIALILAAVVIAISIYIFAVVL